MLDVHFSPHAALVRFLRRRDSEKSEQSELSGESGRSGESDESNSFLGLHLCPLHEYATSPVSRSQCWPVRRHLASDHSRLQVRGTSRARRSARAPSTRHVRRHPRRCGRRCSRSPPSSSRASSRIQSSRRSRTTSRPAGPSGASSRRPRSAASQSAGFEAPRQRPARLCALASRSSCARARSLLISVAASSSHSRPHRRCDDDGRDDGGVWESVGGRRCQLRAGFDDGESRGWMARMTTSAT